MLVICASSPLSDFKTTIRCNKKESPATISETGGRIAARLLKHGCMAIMQEIFEAFLKCHTKAHLIGHGVGVDQSAIDPPLKELDDTYRHRGSDELRAAVANGQLYIGTPSVKAIKRRLYALIADCSLSTPNLKAELHGLRLVRAKHLLKAAGGGR